MGVATVKPLAAQNAAGSQEMPVQNAHMADCSSPSVPAGAQSVRWSVISLEPPGLHLSYEGLLSSSNHLTRGL